MNKIRAVRLAGICVVCALAAFAVMNFSGCDEAVGTSGLTITPSFVQLTTVSNVVEFVVTGVESNDLALPLEWTVSNSELGYIDRSSGCSALYVRRAVFGDNFLTARDQYGNEGYAWIRQVHGGQSLALSKSQADSKTWTVVVTSSAGGPFEWWVHDPAVGTTSSAGTEASVVYTVKDDAESNDVYVRDSAGNIGSVTIP